MESGVLNFQNML